MAQPQTPIYSWFTPYKSGLGLTYLTTATISVAAGSCTNSTDANLIVLPLAKTVNTAVTGAGGIDNGVLTASTFYAVYAIASSSNPIIDEDSTEADGANDANPYPPSALLSKSYSAPSLPFGYDMYRYIGSVLMDGSSHILSFLQIDTKMMYDTAIAELAGGTSATYANIDVATSIPVAGLEGIFKIALTPTAAADSVNMLPYGVTATNGHVTVSGDVAAVVNTVSGQVCATGSNSGVPTVQYKVTGAVTITTQGYFDQF